MKPTEREIHLKMIDTLCNMLSAERINVRTMFMGMGAKPLGEENPEAIRIAAMQIAERELKEQK